MNGGPDHPPMVMEHNAGRRDGERLPDPRFGLIVFYSVCALVGLLYLANQEGPRSRDRRVPPPGSLLKALSANEFSADSTTPIPISTVSVWMKRLLSRDETVPQDLLSAAPPGDTMRVAPVRRWLNAKRLRRISGILCGGPSPTMSCNVNEVDPHFGITPLHVAAASGDEELREWLLDRGADADVVDNVGRKAHNLTYGKFIANSKRWAKAAGRTHCDLPEVVFEDGMTGAELAHARSEASRLVSEGEPVLLRGVLRHYAPKIVDEWTVEKFIETHGSTPVTVGSVPYAGAFSLETSRMSLKEYFSRFVVSSSEAPLYVFDRAQAINGEGYEAILAVLRDMFPIPKLIADPDEAGGLDGCHFYLGRPNSGAPFHIHADALNAVVSGSKRWFVYTPARTLYSRTPVKEWLETEYPLLSEDEKPLECVQEAGDMVYVPLDWGHAVVNLEENTFGYALELLNKRDTFVRYRSAKTAALHDEL